MLIFWGGGNAAALFFEVFDVPNKKKTLSLQPVFRLKDYICKNKFENNKL